MKTAKSFVTLAVLAVAASFASGAGAQAVHPQKPAMRAPRAHQRARAARVHRAAVMAAPAPARAESPKPENPEALVSRRDPFSPLVAVSTGSAVAEHLPPGKAGLVIGTVHVDGAVKSPNGMLAVVSNPQDRVYFIRVGDRLFDGDVQKISLDGVTFRENSKDAFGKPVDRLVTKRIYPNAGEQQ